MELNMESRADLAKFLRAIISRLEEEERILTSPVVLATPFVYYPPPTNHPFAGKLSFTATKRRLMHAASLNSPYSDPMFKNIFQTSKIRDDRIVLRSCIAKSGYLNRDQKEFLLALFFNNTERAEFLLKRGEVNINGSEWNLFNRPLNLAAEFGFVDLVKLLLRNGANPNVADRMGYTALQVAARRNQIEVVKLLLEAGAVADSRNSSGKSAIQLAGTKLTPLGGDPSFMELKTNVTKQVVDLLTQYVDKQKESTEDDLLNAFQTRLRLSENKEQLKDELGNMVEELSTLSIENSNDDNAAPTPTISN